MSINVHSFLGDLGLLALKGDSKEVYDVTSSPLFAANEESPKVLREKAKVLAREIIMQYKIGNQDAIALQCLLLKIIQSEILEGVSGCCVDAPVAINTGYVLEIRIPISLIRIT